jgi:SAM-dependent methyltransferase
MAAIARDHGVAVEEGTFEHWDDAGRTFDLLTAAQAWHWVDPHVGAAKAAHVIRPGGRIGLFWNQPQPEGSTRRVMQAAYREHAPVLGRQSVLLGQRSMALYEGMAEALQRTGQFDDIELMRFTHHVTYSTDQWLGLAATHSDHHTLPPEQLSGLLRALKGGLDALGGGFTMRYETLLVTGRTLAEADR